MVGTEQQWWRPAGSDHTRVVLTRRARRWPCTTPSASGERQKHPSMMMWTPARVAHVARPQQHAQAHCLSAVAAAASDVPLHPRLCAARRATPRQADRCVGLQRGLGGAITCRTRAGDGSSRWFARCRRCAGIWPVNAVGLWRPAAAHTCQWRHCQPTS